MSVYPRGYKSNGVPERPVRSFTASAVLWAVFFALDTLEFVFEDQGP